MTYKPSTWLGTIAKHGSAKRPWEQLMAWQTPKTKPVPPPSR